MRMHALLAADSMGARECNAPKMRSEHSSNRAWPGGSSAAMAAAALVGMPPANAAPATMDASASAAASARCRMSSTGGGACT